MVESYIGLGSNLGDRERTIGQAFERLANTPDVSDAVCSSLYYSEPWGVVDQPTFVNAVARVTTDLGPLQLYCVLRRIEGDLGRTRTFRWGPREIDLDLLLFGDHRIDRRGLVVPHPSMCDRAFVLAPLRELRPDYRSPNGQSIDDMLAGLKGGPGWAKLG